jgi:hypothetical protein
MLAIHHRKGSFSDQWITYCEENNIPYKIVNCYDSDIVNQVKDSNGLMWHWSHSNVKENLFARQLIYSLEYNNLPVFPNSNTCWHFDDKIAQKYLLEAIEAPLITTHIFYDKESAIKWSQETTYPIVFKLRNGAGSINVKLINNIKESKKIIYQAFGIGFNLISNTEKVKDRLGKWIQNKNMNSFRAFIRGLALFVFPRLDLNYKLSNKEKGYVYFQEFIPNNKSDIRVIIIGDKAIGIRRGVRQNDFKASGSGIISYLKDEIPNECIKIAFEINQKLRTQSIAFDFIKSSSGFKIIEISYGFSQKAYYKCPGYWDQNLNWHQKVIKPEDLIIESFLRSINYE